jgi:glycosyltransferase involved in cell wall biosynthesis
MGVEVHICHTGPLAANALAMGLAQRGCIYHDSRDWASLVGMHCISFCNGEFLEQLPEIRRFARTVSFANCMTWNFKREIEMQERGFIDFHLYQTQHGMDRLSPSLASLGNYKPLLFTPYFWADEFPLHTARPTDKFRFGRISRGDADKFGAHQLWIYETMTAPVLKEGLILGWDQRARNRFGQDPPPFVTGLPEGAITQGEFYRICEAVIMTTDTTENLPRVGLEAIASGSILVVDNRGGWQQLIEDGVTGWLCNDNREFVYKASRCAFESEERDRMRLLARQRLDRWGLSASMDSWAQVFQAWAKLR